MPLRCALEPGARTLARTALPPRQQWHFKGCRSSTWDTRHDSSFHNRSRISATYTVSKWSDRESGCRHPCPYTNKWGHRRQVAASAVGSADAAFQQLGRSSGAQQSIRRFYDALNNRDVSTVASCLAQDARYENLGVEGVLSGCSAVSQFCVESMLSVPDDAVFVLEQQTGGDDSSIAVVWRLLLSSSQTVLSRGIAFYTLNRQGLITGVTECYEHPVKISQSSLPFMRPLVKSLAAPLLPAVQQVSRTLQQGAVDVLSPLTAVAGIVQLPGAASPARPPADSPSDAQWASASTASPAGGAGLDTSSEQQISSARLASGSSSGYGSNQSNGPRTSSKGAFAAATATVSGAEQPLAYSQGQAATRRRATAAAAGSGPQAVIMQDFSGLWAKDAARSDAEGYETLLDVLGLSGLQKVTARLIEGLEIKQTSKEFSVSFVTVVPFFKVTERVPLNGGSTQQNRRDLRPGKQTAAARSVAEGGVLVEMTWGQPLAGCLTELYKLLEDGSLCVHAEVQVGQQRAAADTVYRRSGGSRSDLLSESRRRNGSLGDVMQRQKQQGLDV